MRVPIVSLAAVAALTAGAAAAAQAVPPPVRNAGSVTPPPVQFVPPAATTTLVYVISYDAPPAVVTCRDGEARVLASEPFPLAVHTRFRPASPSPSAAAHPIVVPPSPDPAPPTPEYQFDISADGRVASLKRTAAAAAYVAGYDDDALQAALVSWRFAPAVRSGCRLAVRGRFTPLEETDARRLAELPARRVAMNAEVSRRVYDRVRPEGADCASRGRILPRVLTYPRWERLTLRPGGRDWTAVVYDLDAQGRVVNPRTLASSGDAAFDAEALRAASQSSYNTGPRRGCVMHLSTPDAPMPAPERLSTEGLRRPGDDDCPKDLMKWSPARPYPAAFRARGVEGYALLRFDVAPWGEIGAVEVLQAEPAEAFGRTAREMLMTARANPGQRGYKGCLVPVMFKMPPDDPGATGAP